MNLNKDTMFTLVILLVVTVFFHFRQYQTNNQVDEIAAKVIAMQENVEKIAYVTDTEIKNLKNETSKLKTIKKDSTSPLTKDELEGIKKQLKSISLQKSAKKKDLILCAGAREGVIKLYSSGKFIYYESTSVAISKPTGKGTYDIEGPFFVYSGIFQKGGKNKNITGRAFITNLVNETISTLSIASSVYTFDACTKGVLTKFR